MGEIERLKIVAQMRVKVKAKVRRIAMRQLTRWVWNNSFYLRSTNRRLVDVDTNRFVFWLSNDLEKKLIWQVK